MFGSIGYTKVHDNHWASAFLFSLVFSFLLRPYDERTVLFSNPCISPLFDSSVRYNPSAFLRKNIRLELYSEQIMFQFYLSYFWIQKLYRIKKKVVYS